MQQLPEHLAGLAFYRQFLGYKLIPGNKPGKMDKIPLSPHTGAAVGANDPAGWSDFNTAAAMVAQGRAHGVAFCFTANDPFWFLDIDNCMVGGQWTPLAHQLMAATAGAAIEVSSSGTGLHVIGTGLAPDHGCKNKALDIEFYTVDRFVALTGAGCSGDVLADLSSALPWLVQTYFPPGTGSDWEWSDGPCEGWDGPAEDAGLIEQACSSASTAAKFGFKASFKQLWEADAEALSRHYPPTKDTAWDESSADAALAAHLAFWTGKDCERMQRLMWQSGLVREKWNRSDYVPRTIERACGGCQAVYGQKRDGKPDGLPPEPVTPSAPSAAAQRAIAGVEPELLTGFQYLAAQQQIEHFRGCVYVRNYHRVFVPDGSMLNPDRFKAEFGGYVFALDYDAGKTTKNAWEAFTESQAVRFPKVARSMFRPDLPPGRVFDNHGVPTLNNYVPPAVTVTSGDPAPFLRHLEKLLPDERDRATLLAYMAACVQHKGVKFQWWPLIQGVEGNGKTLLSECVAEAVGREHVHSPKAEHVSNKFNSWMQDKVFIYIEDVYYPEHKREIIEALKPLITNRWQEIERKGQDQSIEYVCANGMLNSNHKDAIKKTRNDRRFCFFYTAQQNAEDLQRDGMTGRYFPDLYGWLKADGFAIVANFLAEYSIPDELNPAGSCQRAPQTSSTDEAIEASLGSVEQEIREACSEGRPGFAGGWVSSIALNRLLEQRRLSRAIPPNKRRELMQSIGYDWHPGLRDGRVNNYVATDQGKPKLFIRKGHLHANLTTPAEIVRHYEDAQQPDGSAGNVAVDAFVNNG